MLNWLCKFLNTLDFCVYLVMAKNKQFMNLCTLYQCVLPFTDGVGIRHVARLSQHLSLPPTSFQQLLIPIWGSTFLWEG